MCIQAELLAIAIVATAVHATKNAGWGVHSAWRALMAFFSSRVMHASLPEATMNSSVPKSPALKSSSPPVKTKLARRRIASTPLSPSVC